MRLRILIFLCSIFFFVVMQGQRNYRVRDFKTNIGGRIQYILPPTTNIKFNTTGKLKDRFTYSYILFEDLNENYSLFLKSINNAKIWQGDINYFAINNEKEIGKNLANLKVSLCNSAIVEKTFFKTACLDNSGKRFFIQVEMNKLVENTPLQNFDSFAVELLRSLVAKEGVHSCGCVTSIKWPNGITIDIIQKIKDWMPLPLRSDLAGPCLTTTTTSSSFTLLTQDIVLKVDNTSRSSTGVGVFVFDWHGINLFSYKKNEEGVIIQNPFAVFGSGLPSNLIDGQNSNTTYKISSFADIQNSNALSVFPYIGLFHPKLKQNNNNSSLGDYTVTDNDELVKGTAFLVHLLSTDLSTLGFDYYFDSGDSFTKSIFGKRNSIEPLIPIYLNKQYTLVSLETYQKNISNVPAKNRLYRKYDNGYRRVKGNKTNVLLLPNDHINYKL